MAGRDDAPPHPRFSGDLVGHAAASRELSAGNGAGRLHHAWLIGGPEGIGKATLAYRFARRLLAAPSERLEGGDGLGVDPDGRTARQIAAGAHPNLVGLERPVPEDGKPAPKTIGVEAVRKALSLFSTTATDGGRRICIIDPVEDLTVPAANALLKTVEEPPAGALILIVSHAPQRVLSTIRSRCRKLSLAALETAEVRAVLISLGHPDDDVSARAASLSEGSVGRALAMLDPKRVALLDEVTALLDELPAPAPRRVFALADRVGDRKAADEFPLVLDRFVGWLSLRIRAGQHLGAARLAPLAEVCENLQEAARAVEAYNLDRRAFIVSTFGDLAEAVRRAG